MTIVAILCVACIPVIAGYIAVRSMEDPKNDKFHEAITRMNG